MKLPNGSWTGFLGELQRNECDVSFALFSPTAERNRLAEASYPMWYEDMIIVGGFSKDTVQQTSIANSFFVFGAEVWGSLLGSLVVFAVILSLVPGSRLTFLFRLKDNIFQLLASVFLEAAPVKARQSSSRIVIAFWCLAMLVVTNLFTAKMKAALTVRQPTGQRVDSPAQLAERHDMNVYMMGGTAYPKLLSISPRDYDRKVYRMLKPSSFLSYRQLFSAAVLDEVSAGKAVLLSDRTTAMYKLAALCKRYPDHEFYISRERFFFNLLVVYYSRERSTVMHLMKKWEKRVKWLNEAGVVSKWHHDTVSLGADFSRCPKVQQEEAETLNFEHHRSVFLMILAGNGIACAVLGAEMLLSKSIVRSCNGSDLRARRRAARMKRKGLMTMA
ncbi:glutamate receptor-like [Dermacentor variabilis]|uniref:glutamate receptor-like n=1 Tax=Dermacentor variabilis TaxID=34621 RepID=UPI003F5C4C1B